MASEAEGFKRILETLDRMEIPYLVGGSVASSIYGIPRMTRDVDLVVDLRAAQIEEFAELLKSDFYADPNMMRDAWRSGRACNLIHYASAYKFDLFPLKSDEYSQTQMRRRTYRETRSVAGEPIECAVATAEDTLLNKLSWYRAGGETSERQWDDVRGILRVQGGALDLEYLQTWAPKLGVADLLNRLLSE
jgi:Domain of unknown function (DUF1814).